MRDLLAFLQQWPRSVAEPLLMGVLNLTPDSFHDGGCYNQLEAGCDQALRLSAQGADIIDIGAASSRPGFSEVSAQQELQRLLPVLSRLSQLSPASPLPPLSVDTDKPQVAAAALAAGASMLNDTSGAIDSPCFELAAGAAVPLCVMYRDGVAADASPSQLLAAVREFFLAAIGRARAVGLPLRLLLLDPGLGFKQTPQQSLALLEHLPQLARLGQPLLLGYSHKRCAAALSGEQPGQAPRGNAMLARRLLGQGAAVIRLHEIDAYRQAVAGQADAILTRS